MNSIVKVLNRTFEKSSGMFLFEGEENPGGFPDHGERELDAPYLTLVAKSELADQFQFLWKKEGERGISREQKNNDGSQTEFKSEKIKPVIASY